MEVIKKLVRKEYKSMRPTAHQINEVIKRYDLSLYTADGKRRNREVIAKAIAKVIESL